MEFGLYSCYKVPDIFNYHTNNLLLSFYLNKTTDFRYRMYLLYYLI
jgi:hypothetical protein